MTVKTIFKVLIGTTILIVVSALTIEYFNIATTAMQIRQISNIACEQASILFSQETYKRRETSGSINMSPVLDGGGNEFVSGKFYNSISADSIYTEIYTSDEFKKWCESSAAIKGNWESIKIINLALNNSNRQYNNETNYGETDVNKLAKSYREVLMTPLNMGIPYLDKTTVDRMFKWNITKILSNCDSDLITPANESTTGEAYVRFKGFKVFTARARITNLEYKVFNLNDNSERAEFKNITNIDPTNIGFDTDIVTGDLSSDERSRICLVGITYNVPMAYEGITPLKSIIAYVWDTKVKGVNSNTDRSNAIEYRFNDNAIGNMTSGGLRGDTTGVLPVPGQLIYYIVR